MTAAIYLVSALVVFSGSVLAADGATHADWTSYGGTYSAWRYSALERINRENVHKLVPVWVFQTGDYQNGLQATPIAIDGVLYLSTSSNWVFALDGATGQTLWEYHFPLTEAVPFYGKQNRGVAVGADRVWMGTADNHLVALDRKTGEEVWRVNVEDSRQCGCNITGAPLAIKDLVVVGVTGGDSAHRGYLTAFDAKVGEGTGWSFFQPAGGSSPGPKMWASQVAGLKYSPVKFVCGGGNGRKWMGFQPSRGFSQK